MKKDKQLLENLRNGVHLSFKDRLSLVLLLSYPTVIAMMTSVITEYIDAAMVGRIGAEKAASIGLIASTMWLVGSLVGAVSTGFSVQVAHRIGAKEEKEARSVVRHGLLLSLCFALFLMLIGLLLYRHLPIWLGGSGEIARDASRYAIVYVIMLPIMQLSRSADGMLQSSGNTKIAGAIGVIICVLDACFNYLLIFETRTVYIFGNAVTVPGAGLDVMGASLGTMLAETVGMCIAMYYLFFKLEWNKIRNHGDGSSDTLVVWNGERIRRTVPVIKKELSKALRISTPIAIEMIIMNSAQIMITKIVVPLGAVSIAANSFAITAEGFCYMPGYGIAIAATTLIGQSIGANRKELAGKLAYMVTAIGMVIMAVTGVILYAFAPQIMSLISPDPEIIELGAAVLRIEAFAEPLFAAGMVVGGVFRGTGNTLFPSIANLISMWAIRIPLAAYLTPKIGLRGAWIAMCVELSIRGIFFIIMLVVWKKRKTEEH
ncbi:MAG: MATE family efflux transporter [Lachnospiraceae bacterium]|nr:MATE family efflux transporter [Lachnospiraceae bacterium]